MFSMRMKNVLSKMDDDELISLKVDLNKDDSKFMKLISEELNKRSLSHQKYCTTCGAKIDVYNEENYTIIFGPEGLRKKASFCGIDCMQYFLSNMKKHKLEPKREELI